MNKLLLSIVFSVTVLTIIMPAQMAFSATTTLDINNTGNACESIGGTWDGGTKTCTMDFTYTVITGDKLEIESGVTLVFIGAAQPTIGKGSLHVRGETINHGTMNMNGGTGDSGGSLRINLGGIQTNHGTINMNGADGNSGGMISISDGTLTNQGTINLNGGDGPKSGSLENGDRFGDGKFTNECSGTINTQGGIGIRSGTILNDVGLATNHGSINLNGGQGPNSGDLVNSVTVDNSGAINEISALFVNNGILNQVPSPCAEPIVGGESLPIDSTALLLAGAQTFSWMIPLVLSVLGIGLFVASRKSE